MDNTAPDTICPAFPFARHSAVEPPELYAWHQDNGPVNVFSRSKLTEPDAPWFSALRPPSGVLTTTDPVRAAQVRPAGP